jgi:hypothetical protein
MAKDLHMTRDKQIRAWAKRNGYRLSDKYPVPLFVEMAYRKAR